MVLAQVGGGGEGGDLPPAPEFLYLRDFLAERPLTRDGDAWLAVLMAQERGQMLGGCAAGAQPWRRCSGCSPQSPSRQPPRAAAYHPLWVASKQRIRYRLLQQAALRR